jgi:hypothetical protein
MQTEGPIDAFAEAKRRYAPLPEVFCSNPGLFEVPVLFLSTSVYVRKPSEMNSMDVMTVCANHGIGILVMCN